MTRRSTLPQVAKDSYLDSSDIIAKLSEVASAAAAAGGPPFDGSKVCLSAVMADVVFKKMAAHARRSEGEVVAIEEIARACEGKMAEFYELKTATGTEIKRGSIKAIKVVVESLQGGRKHMTHVQNIDAWGIDPEVARSELQVLNSSARARLPREFHCVFLPLFPRVIVVMSCSGFVRARARCNRCLATTARSCKYRARSTLRSLPKATAANHPVFLAFILAQAIAYLTKTFGIEARYIEKK